MAAGADPRHPGDQVSPNWSPGCDEADGFHSGLFYPLDDEPRLEATRTETVVRTDSEQARTRWPAFADAASPAGIKTSLSCRALPAWALGLPVPRDDLHLGDAPPVREH
ncbi:hypothetical protein AB0M83_09255 [Amycolatopsis sp. NPDC051106]|uniref:hypothetical protein n=1 Tax=unclassified Amycolatopsis TaxID=2618356 RepID=UPI0034354732